MATETMIELGNNLYEVGCKTLSLLSKSKSEFRNQNMEDLAWYMHKLDKGMQINMGNSNIQHRMDRLSKMIEKVQTLMDYEVL